MKLQNLQEAKYADPKWEKLKKYLKDNKPKEGYLMLFFEDNQSFMVEFVQYVYDNSEEGDFFAVIFVNSDEWSSYNPQYFLDNIQVFQTKRIL